MKSGIGTLEIHGGTLSVSDVLKFIEDRGIILLGKSYFYLNVGGFLFLFVFIGLFIYFPIKKQYSIHFHFSKFWHYLFNFFMISLIILGFIYQVIFEFGYGSDGPVFWQFYYIYISIPLLIIITIILFIRTTFVKKLMNKYDFGKYKKKMKNWFKEKKRTSYKKKKGVEKEEKKGIMNQEKNNSDKSYKRFERGNIYINKIKKSILKNLRKKIIPFIILFLVIFIFFQRMGLLNKDLITLDDFSVEAYRGWFYLNYGINYFHSIITYSFFFFSGYPEIAFFTPGLPVLFGLFGILGSPLWLSQRLMIIIIITTLFYIVSNYRQLLSDNQQISSKNLKYINYWSGFLIFMNGVWIKFIHNGQLGYLFSFLFALISVFLTLNIQKNLFPEVEEKKYENKSRNIEQDDHNNIIKAYNSSIIIGIFLGLTIFFNFISGLFLGVFYLIDLLYYKRNFQKKINLILPIIIRIILGFTAVTSFWLITTPYITLTDLFPSIQTFQNSSSINSNNISGQLSEMYTQYNKYNIELFYHMIPVYLWPAIIFGFILGKKHGTKSEKILNLLNITLLFFLMLSPWITLLYSMTISRLIIYNEILNLIPIFRFLDYLKKRIHYLTNTLSFSKIKLKNSDVIFIFNLILIFNIMFGITVRLYSPFYKYSGEDDDAEEIIKFLGENVDLMARYLWEDFPHNSPYNTEAEHSVSLVPILTGKNDASGNRLFSFFHQSYDASCIDGVAFNVPFSEMNVSFFIEKLTQYNIQYIIGWSVDMQKFMRANNEIFPVVFSGKNLILYNNTLFNNSYLLETKYNTTNYKLVEYKPTYLRYSIEIIEEYEELTWQFNDFPNWHVVVNGTEYEKDKESNYRIKISINYPGNYSIEIKWIESKLEQIAKIVNTSMILIVFIILIYQNKKYQYNNSHNKYRIKKNQIDKLKN